MKVQELINILEDFDRDAEVLIRWSNEEASGFEAPEVEEMDLSLYKWYDGSEDYRETRDVKFSENEKVIKQIKAIVLC